MNDNLDHDGRENSIASYFFLEQFYEEYFPDQSPMEKFNYYPHDLYVNLDLYAESSENRLYTGMDHIPYLILTVFYTVFFILYRILYCSFRNKDNFDYSFFITDGEFRFHLTAYVIFDSFHLKFAPFMMALHIMTL